MTNRIRDKRVKIFAKTRVSVWHRIRGLTDPTGPFTILEPQYQKTGEFCVVQERLTTDFKALDSRRFGRWILIIIRCEMFGRLPNRFSRSSKKRKE